MAALCRSRVFVKASVSLLNFYQKRGFIVSKAWKPRLLPRRCFVFYSTSTFQEKGETEVSQKDDVSLENQETVENNCSFDVEGFSMDDESDREKLLRMFDNSITEACQNDALSDEEKLKTIQTCLNKLNAINVKGTTVQTFTALSKYLLRNAQKLDTEALINSTEFYMKVQINKYVCDTLLHSCIWRVRDCPAQDVFKILHLMSVRTPFPPSKKWTELTKLCKDRVRQEVSSISSAKQLCDVLKILKDGKESPKVIQLLEESSIVLLPTMNGNQMSTLLYFLACHNSRNLFLRKITVAAVMNQTLDLQPNDLENLFFSCAKLGIHNKKLLSQMATHLVKTLTLGYINQRFLVNILTSCSFIGWWNSTEMDAVLKYFKLENGMEKDKRASLIFSLTRLNVQDCEKLLQTLAEGQDATNQPRWLDMVHSLACVKQADSSMMKSVLDPSFYEPLLQKESGKHAFKQLLIKKKLLNILGCLCIDLEHSGQEASLLPSAKTWKDELQQSIERAPTGNRVQEIRKALSSIVSNQVRVKDTQIDQYGNRIDFEVLPTFESKSRKRVLIKVLQYDDMVHGDQESRPNGMTAMTLRLLSATHPDVISVPYYLTEDALKTYLNEALKDFM